MKEGLLRTPLGIYVLKDDTHLSRWVEQHRRLDLNIDECTTLSQYLPEGGTVINAGAFLGDHALTYSQMVGPRGEVHAFEPHRLSFEALSYNMGRLRNVTCYNLALGERDETAWLNPDENVGASFVQFAPVAHAGVVSICRLDSLVLSGRPKVDRLDMVHLDAEGFELPVLRGAAALISRHRPVLVLEVCPRHMRRQSLEPGHLFDWLVEHGYEWSFLHPQPGPEQYDIVCIPK